MYHVARHCVFVIFSLLVSSLMSARYQLNIVNVALAIAQTEELTKYFSSTCQCPFSQLGGQRV